MKTPKDKLGTEICVGDYLIYGHAIGRSASLRIGKVLKITEKEVRGSWESGFTITVIGVDDDWAHKEVELCKSKGHLLFPNRTINVAGCLLPKKVKDLLDAFR